MRIRDWSSDVCSSDLAAGDIDAWMMEGVFQTHAEVGEEGGELGYRRHDLAPAGGAEREAPDPAVVLCDLADEGADVHQAALAGAEQLGRASCRDRVCQYVSFSVVAVA